MVALDDSRYGPPIRYDWATGDRCWGDHVHHKLPDEPIGYASWHEWAKRHGKTHGQVACSTPGCPILRWSDDPEVTS